MPEYLSPGVYVEEVSSGAKPLEGVGTSTGAFIGKAQRGPVNEARLITNWTQFTDTFGTFIKDCVLAYSVYQFFNEGGTKCYVVRGAKGSATTLTKSQFDILDSAAANTLTVLANSEGVWGDDITVKVEDESIIPGETTARADYFKLVIEYDGDEVEAFDNVSMLDSVIDHVALRVNSKWIEVVDTADTRPTNGTYPLVGGLDGDALVTTDWASADGFIFAFDPIDDINIVAIPDALGNPIVTIAAYTYCLNRGDCFYVADTIRDLALVTEVVTFRQLTGQFNSSYAALYYPWIEVSDPRTGGTILTPPCGAIVGTYSHTDVVRGVHKAPAGIDVGYLNSAVGVEYKLTKGEHDVLNPIGVNVIRSFPGTGTVVWGARTLSADSEWKYINIRRLFLMLEETIDEGTQWVVFEPNTPKLWGNVKRNITAFLTGVWRGGALFGATAQEAFYVKVDGENNPPDSINAGKLIIEIGVAPVKPAEFVIIRITQKAMAPA